MIARTLAPVRVLVALLVTLSVFLVGTGSAEASSSGQSLLTNNAWIVAELATTPVRPASSPAVPSVAVITDPAGKLDPVLWESTRPGSTAVPPVGITRAPSTTAKPRPKLSGRAGLILNTGVVLLSFAGLAFSGDDVVDYTGPLPPAAPTFRPGWQPDSFTFSRQTITATADPATAYLATSTNNLESAPSPRATFTVVKRPGTTTENVYFRTEPSAVSRRDPRSTRWATRPRPSAARRGTRPTARPGRSPSAMTPTP